MKIEEMKINQKYTESMRGIVTKDSDGVVWLHDGYMKWKVSDFIEERQKEIFDSLEKI